MAYGSRTWAEEEACVRPGARDSLFVRTDSHRQVGSAGPQLLLQEPHRLGGVSHGAPLSTDEHQGALHPLDVSDQHLERTPSIPTPKPGPRGKGRLAHTYAGGDGRAALLVAFGAAVARNACHAVLAGTLAGGLVAGFASGSHGMAITRCGEHTTGGSEGGKGPVYTLPRGPSPPRGTPWTPPQGKSRNGGAGPAKPTHIPEADNLATCLPGNGE